MELRPTDRAGLTSSFRFHRAALICWGSLVPLDAWGVCSTGTTPTERVPGEPRGQFVFHEENDAFAIGSGSDESYTQGLRLAYAFERGCEPEWVSNAGRRLRTTRLARSLNFADETAAELRATLGIGQHLFTPNDLSVPSLLPVDRPYAAYLYGTVRLDFTEPKMLETTNALARSYLNGSWYGQTQSSFELQVGVVGPLAGGEWAQSTVHDLIGDEDPKGWDNQLPDEPGVFAEYTWRRRFAHHSDRFDVVPSGSLAVGNVQTYVGAAVIVRYGKNITGFHTDPLTPVADPRDVLDRIDQVCGLKIFVECYAFIGVEGRAVGHNIFLDGSTSAESHSVDKETFVYDLTWGARFRFGWRSLTLDYAFVQRSNEFSPVPPGADQPDGKHDYGMVTLRWTTFF